MSSLLLTLLPHPHKQRNGSVSGVVILVFMTPETKVAILRSKSINEKVGKVLEFGVISTLGFSRGTRLRIQLK